MQHTRHHQSESCRLLECGIAVRQGLRFLDTEVAGILAKRSDVLSRRMMRIIEDVAGDWRPLDERIEGLPGDITSLVARLVRRQISTGKRTVLAKILDVLLVQAAWVVLTGPTELGACVRVA